jgi:hypothetical protein
MYMSSDGPEYLPETERSAFHPLSPAATMTMAIHIHHFNFSLIPNRNSCDGNMKIFQNSGRQITYHSTMASVWCAGNGPNTHIR